MGLIGTYNNFTRLIKRHSQKRCAAAITYNNLGDKQRDSVADVT
jgi:hypothetical protein